MTCRSSSVRCPRSGIGGNDGRRARDMLEAQLSKRRRRASAGQSHSVTPNTTYTIAASWDRLRKHEKRQPNKGAGKRSRAAYFAIPEPHCVQFLVLGFRVEPVEIRASKKPPKRAWCRLAHTHTLARTHCQSVRLYVRVQSRTYSQPPILAGFGINNSYDEVLHFSADSRLRSANRGDLPHDVICNPQCCVCSIDLGRSIAVRICVCVCVCTRMLKGRNIIIAGKSVIG